jgi:hypothetical protein
MSFSYHWVCVSCFGQVVEYARNTGRKLPDHYTRRLEKAWDYIAFALKPDGHNPLTADSDRENFRKRVLGAADTFQREDWRFIATDGKEGKRPADPPSRCWPDSGQFVMRDGWGAAAQWAYFDAGPHGGWHGHFDKLHLSVGAGGRPLLVDGGRYWYKGDTWRRYFKGSASHNVILIDGEGQEPAQGSRLETSHAICPEFDFVRAAYRQGFGGKAPDAVHTRAVVYLRGQCWIVADHVAVRRPRTIEALWHFHPDCTVEQSGLTVASVDAGKANLRVLPVGSPSWQLDLVKGRTKPTIQGWYSPEYNVKHPNTAAIYSAKVERGATFAWVLVPAKGPVPKVGVRALDAPPGAVRLEFALPGRERTEVAIRLFAEKPVPLSNGLTLEGDCAIVRPGLKPLVAGGRITEHARKP